MAYGKKFGEIVKEGAIAGGLLYPASKLVWAVDSMAKNMAPVGLPSFARTPLVTMGLGALSALLPAGGVCQAFGEMVLAAGLVQTVQQAGAPTPGAPGIIDNQVNKLFTPLANVGMKGYVQRLRGYVEQRQMKGYVQGPMKAANLPEGSWRPAPTHPNDLVSQRGAGLRGMQATHLLSR